MKFRTPSLFLLGLTVLAQAPIAAASGADPSLPARAFLVEGGSVILQGGVMQDPELMPLPFGKMKYPTRYFLRLSNETSIPIWLDVEWRVNPKKPGTLKSKEISPGKGYITWWKDFGVIWDQPVAFKVVAYSDSRRTKIIGSEETAFRFDSKEKEPFLALFKMANTAAGVAPMMSGWREMGMPLTNVAGTTADAKLQRDVQLLLWMEESKYHRDCEHTVLRAEHHDTASAIALIAPSAETQKVIDAHDKNDTRSERWWIKSCDATSSYVVLMIRSSEKGTDILAHKMPDEPVP